MTTEHKETGFIQGFNPGEIYDYPIKNMTTAGVFRYAGVDVIPLHDKCYRCGQAIHTGGGYDSVYVVGAVRRYCSEICRKFGDWSSTQKNYPIISIEHLITRAVHYIGEAHNNRAGEAINDRA